MKYLIILSLISYSLQINHCINEEKTCDTCKSGYNLVGSICQNTPIAYCQTLLGSICSECQIGYELNNDQTLCNKITVTIPNCVLQYKSDNNDNLCYSCEKEYFPSEDKKSCVKIEHCKQASSYDPTYCYKCNNYYYPNDEGQCEPDYCEVKDIGDNCIKCYSPLVFDDELKNCIKSPVAYCSFYYEGICERCINGYTVSSDGQSCKKDSQKEEDNCSIYEDEDEGTCATCNPGYTLDSNQKCQDNCAHYTATGCLLCEADYISFDGVNCEYFGSEKNNGRFFEYYLGLLSLILFFILKLNYISLDIKLKK